MKRIAGQESLDGFVVESYEGRISGSFDVVQDDGRKLGYNDEVLLIVQGHVKAPAYKTDSNGDLKRVHTFEANEVTIVTDGDTWTKVEDIVGVVGTRGQERLFNPLWSVDHETGEIPTQVDTEPSSYVLDETVLRDDPEMQRAEADVQTDRQAARERARVAAANAMEEGDEPYLPQSSGVERLTGPVGSQDPVLRKFLMEPTSRG